MPVDDNNPDNNEEINEMEKFIDDIPSDNIPLDINPPIITSDGPPPVDSSTIIPPMQINTSAVTHPVMILVGPGNVGKTAVLLRFARYLLSQKCRVHANENFAVGAQYVKNVKYFNEILYDQTQRIPDRNELGTYLLLDVYYENRPIFQILEAPGEDIFSIQKDANNIAFKKYMSTILNKDIPKLYTLFFSPDMLGDDQDRGSYGQRMYQIMTQQFDAERGDQIILLYNKIDLRSNLYKVGSQINQEQAYRSILTLFPQVEHAIEDIRNEHPRIKVKFCTFSSGTFFQDSWQQGSNKFPKNLWTHVQNSLQPEPKPISTALIVGIIVVVILLIVIILLYNMQNT